MFFAKIIGKSEVKAIVKYAKQKAGKAKYVEDITELKTGQRRIDNIEAVDDIIYYWGPNN